VNTNDTCSELDEEVELVPYPSIPEARIICHGTATNFSAPTLEVVVELVVEESDGDVDGVEPSDEADVVDADGLDADGVIDPGVERDDAEELERVSVEDDPEYDSTAKSILPEAGLMMTSSILPKSSPEEVLIDEPVSLLARISCWPIRPVGLNCELEP
jgi:hypothetical protein